MLFFENFNDALALRFDETELDRIGFTFSKHLIDGPVEVLYPKPRAGFFWLGRRRLRWFGLL